jgi:hypothetical protein
VNGIGERSQRTEPEDGIGGTDPANGIAERIQRTDVKNSLRTQPQNESRGRDQRTESDNESKHRDGDCKNHVDMLEIDLLPNAVKRGNGTSNPET